MDAVIRALFNESFYASPETIRSFLMLGMSKEKSDIRLEKKKTISEYGSDTAIIFIEGVMLRERNWYTENGLATSTEEVADEIRKARSEGKRIKLMMNTGGGVVNGTSALAQLVYENREWIDAYATGVVASAGIWVFANAGKRFAEDTTLLGSIGVVTTVFDDEEYWKQMGIVWKEVVSENAKNKRPDPKTESGMAETRRYITQLESIFIESISKSLNMTKGEVVSKFHEGGLITGVEALEIGVISGIINANSKNKEKESMDAKELDQLRIDLAASNEQIQSLNKTIGEKDAKISSLEKTNSDLEAQVKTLKTENEASIKIEDAVEIVGAAQEYGVKKDDAIKMMQSKEVGSALKIALEANKSGGAGANTDIGNEAVNTEAEMALAKAIAARHSVRKK